MRQGRDNVQAGEVALPSMDLAADLTFYTEVLGLRLDMIFPADDPSVAVLSGHGLRIRLERGANVAPAVLRLLCLDPAAFADGERELTAPNGVRIQIVDANPRLSQAFNILSIPTIAFFKPGAQPQGVVGFKPLEQLEQQFGLAEYAVAPAD